MVSPYWQRATLSAVLLALTAAHAIDLSDPSVPCTSGWCAYDTGDGVKTAYSTLILNGSPSSIGDITPAGGWMVSDCPQSWPSGQATIKMSCMQGSSECAKLFSGAGAQNTVVRLPPSCGQGPFARVVSHSSSDSGTNTTSVASKKGKTAEKRAKNNASQVHTMTLDFAFSKIPANSPHGPINMAITSSNVKGPTIDKRWVKQAMRKRGTAAEFHRRGFFSSIANGIDQAVHGVESGIKSVVGDVTSVAKAVATDIKSVASDVTSAAAAVATDIKNGVNTAVHAAENATAFNKTETDNLKPISIQKNFPIINKDLECGPVTGTISLDVDTDVKAQVAFGYVITGTAIPPKLDEFMVMATLNGNVTNTFNVNLGLQGNFDTGSRQLIQTGLPGLSIPGIVTIGPIFSINAELSANFDLEAQMVINTEFDLPNINLVFPPDQGKNSGTESTASGGKQPLKVSLGSGSGTLNGNIDAHLIPRVDFGVEILEGLAKATVFLEMDVSGTLTLEASGQSEGGSGNAATGAGSDGLGGADGTLDDSTADGLTDGSTGTDTAALPDDTDAIPPERRAILYSRIYRRKSSGGSSKKESKVTMSDQAVPTDPAVADQSVDDSISGADNSTAGDDGTNDGTDSTGGTLDGDGASSGTNGTTADDSTLSSADTTRTSIDDGTADAVPPAQKGATGGTIDGTLTLVGGININGGLDGNLGPLGGSKTFPIFKTTKQLFTKKFSEKLGSAKNDASDTDNASASSTDEADTATDTTLDPAAPTKRALLSSRKSKAKSTTDDATSDASNLSSTETSSDPALGASENLSSVACSSSSSSGGGIGGLIKGFTQSLLPISL